MSCHDFVIFLVICYDLFFRGQNSKQKNFQNVTHNSFWTIEVPKTLQAKGFQHSRCPKPYAQKLLGNRSAQNVTGKRFSALEVPKALRTKAFGQSTVHFGTFNTFSTFSNI